MKEFLFNTQIGSGLLLLLIFSVSLLLSSIASILLLSMILGAIQTLTTYVGLDQSIVSGLKGLFTLIMIVVFLILLCVTTLEFARYIDYTYNNEDYDYEEED